MGSTEEEKLDYLLRLISAGDSKFLHIEATFKNEFGESVNLFLSKLGEDKLIRPTVNGYVLTVTAKAFLRDGGYSRREAMGKETYSILRENLFWARIAGVAGLIAVALMVVFFIFENSKK